MFLGERVEPTLFVIRKKQWKLEEPWTKSGKALLFDA